MHDWKYPYSFDQEGYMFEDWFKKVNQYFFGEKKKMSATPKVNWQGDAGFEFVDMKKAGKSHREVADFIYAKYGVSYTIGRISQLYTKFKQEGRFN